MERGRGRESESGFSNYFRERFGSQSPEDYRNIRLSHIDPRVSNNELRDVLAKNFGRYGDHQVKVVNSNIPDDRLAYVNFEQLGHAKRCRKALLPKLQDQLGRYLKLDPAGVIRDQDGRYVEHPPHSHPPPPPPPHDGHPRGGRGGGGFHDFRDFRDDSHRGGAGRQRNFFRRPGPRPPPSSSEEMEDWKQEECREYDATRTLFVGNLPARCDEGYLRKLFGRYGNVESVDIKSPHEGSDAVYAFVQFENLDQSQEAKYYEDGQMIGGKRCNIGYGRSKDAKSRRLFIGGLGPWTSIEALAKEFDRYGAIEKIDYIRDGNHAYALFVSAEAASEACYKMKGFLLNGPSYPPLRCDFSTVPREESTSPPRHRRDSHRSRSTRSYTPEPPPPPPRRSREREREPDERLVYQRQPSPQAPTSRRRTQRHHSPASSRSPTPPSKDSRNVSLSPSRSPTPKKGRYRGPRTPSPPRSPPPPPVCTATSLDELERVSAPSWLGPLVLKKSAYPIALWRLRGGEAFLRSRLMETENGEAVALSVTQRRPFAQSSLADFQKYLTAPADSALVGIATPNPDGARDCELPTRPLRDLVKYLLDKAAGGVVNLKGAEGGAALLYLFPHSEIAEQLLAELAPRCGIMKAMPSQSLLAILVKSSKKA